VANLFDSLTLRGLTLPNRIIVSPMCQYSAQNGNATAWHMAHIGSLALGGAGLFCVEATAVSPEGRITPGCLGLWNDENEQALADVLKVVRATSSMRMAIQLSHAGRKASSDAPWNGGQLLGPDQGGWVPVSPSAVPHRAEEAPPAELQQADLQRILNDFVESAQRAVRLGFDAIELHAAHGYLLHQFLSPIANKRADAYGGSLENRMRFPLDVFKAVRAAVPQAIPVGVRVSATDWVDDEPSWTPEQTVAFGLALKALGCDWIDVSSGGVSSRQKITLGPGYQVPFAQQVKAQVGLPTISVGLITDAHQAQAIVEQGQADMVALGRAMLYDPRWAWHAAAELDAKVDGPRQYWRSLPSGKNAVFGNTKFGQR
jgi:NADPH2 dehydrogenase